MSLINRLVQTTNKQIAQTQMYNLLTKSISEHKNTRKTTESDLFSSYSAAFKNFEFVTLDQYYDEINVASSNWFFNLIRTFVYKANNPVYDCLLFQLFKKLSILIPRLFASLFSNDMQIQQFHETLHAKFSSSATSTPQLVNSMCEFLCASIDYQPSFFQSLTQLETSVNSQNEYSFVEGSMSILKNLFALLECKNEKVRIYNTSLLAFVFLFWFGLFLSTVFFSWKENGFYNWNSNFIRE